MPHRMLCFIVGLGLTFSALGVCPNTTDTTGMETAEVRTYIKRHWDDLTRSLSNIAQAAVDPKVNHAEGTPWLVYISRDEDIAAVQRQLNAILSKEDLKRISLAYLPQEIKNIKTHGLLYVPEAYVVPGSRFNELYAWDSYFIELGLLEDDRIELAQSIVNNFIYEIEHYGTILNGNRTYYLTRSQPPFFSHMVMALYDKTGNISIITQALPSMVKYHDYWTIGPRNIPEIGLSRYYTDGDGPAYEVQSSEVSSDGLDHYQRIIEFFKKWPVYAYDVSKFYDQKTSQLTSLFYKGDRAMRASGYDVSNRYGPFSVDITEYASVTLNVLLYVTEQDISRAYALLGDNTASKKWLDKATERKAKINQYLWNEDIGLYLPYNYVTHQSNPYIYADIFFPLWASIADKQQAERVANYANILLKPGGMMTSAYFTGNQWDAPFAWAPLQLIAVQGLRNYGYTDLANQVSDRFIRNVNYNFKKNKAIFEKYNALNCEINSDKNIKFGYSENQIGFGWTNGVYLSLLK